MTDYRTEGDRLGWAPGAVEFAVALNAGRLTANHVWAREITDCPHPPHGDGQHCTDPVCPNRQSVCWHHNSSEAGGTCTRTVAAANILVDVLQLLGVPVPLSQHTGRGTS
jgi:hypothetical protein